MFVVNCAGWVTGTVCGARMGGGSVHIQRICLFTLLREYFIHSVQYRIIGLKKFGFDNCINHHVVCFPLAAVTI